MKRFIILMLLALLVFGTNVYAADQKITELDAATAITDDDLFVVVDAPGTSPVTKKVTAAIVKKVLIGSDANGMSAAEMEAVGMYGALFVATGAGTWILPVAVEGMNICLMDSGTAHDLILDVTAGSTIRLKGTEQADALGITNATGATTGDFICVVGVAAGKWSTMGMSGTWTSQ